MNSNKKTEIIAIASGKGGTGKTLIGASLGFALINSGHRVLMIDADPATDGLSLFLLGPSGMGQISQFETENTFKGVLHNFQSNGVITYRPHPIHRKGKDDHGVSYEALISGKGLYGAESQRTSSPAVPDLDQQQFQHAIRNLFDAIRRSSEFDYVIVDTRGGFAFESTDVVALADSFIIVTEPDYTSFYQDRTLKDRVNRAAKELETAPLLKGIIVNKATKGEENEFRDALVKEFKVRFTDTYPIALDTEAILAYQVQQIPYRKAPAARFCFDSLVAFSGILQTVTTQWDSNRVAAWNELVDAVKAAIGKHNQEVESQKAAMEEQRRQFEVFKSENASLRETVTQLKAAHEAETLRASEYVETLKRAVADREKQIDRELGRAKERESEQIGVLEKQMELTRERLKQREEDWAREREQLLKDGERQSIEWERRFEIDRKIEKERDQLRKKSFMFTIVSAVMVSAGLLFFTQKSKMDEYERKQRFMTEEFDARTKMLREENARLSILASNLTLQMNAVRESPASELKLQIVTIRQESPASQIRVDQVIQKPENGGFKSWNDFLSGNPSLEQLNSIIRALR